MKNKYKQEFITSFYYDELKNYIAKTNEYFVNQSEVVSKEIRYVIKSLFEKIINIQNEIKIPIKFIHISLMLTSVYKNEPKFRIDVYSEDGIFWESLLHEECSAEHLFFYREEFREKMEAEVKKRHFERYIREEAVNQLVNASLTYLTYLYVYNLKYDFDDIDKIDGYNEIIKTEDFYVMAGGYKDWKKPLFTELSEVDIFFNRDKKSLKFRKYIQKVYSKKSFRAIELQNSRFVECDFRDCDFTDTDLSDCTFTNCIFRGVIFINTICFGILFKECTFKEVVFEKCDFDGSPEKDRKQDEIYRMAEIQDSYINSIQYVNCDLQNHQLNNCKIEKLIVDGESKTLNSDLEQYKETKDAIFSYESK